MLAVTDAEFVTMQRCPFANKVDLLKLFPKSKEVPAQLDEVPLYENPNVQIAFPAHLDEVPSEPKQVPVEDAQIPEKVFEPLVHMDEAPSEPKRARVNDAQVPENATSVRIDEEMLKRAVKSALLDIVTQWFK